MTAQVVPIRDVGSERNVTSKGRRKNTAYRVHEHLTEGQMDSKRPTCPVLV